MLGAAWMVGALKALELELGVDVRTFDALRRHVRRGRCWPRCWAPGCSVDDLRHPPARRARSDAGRSRATSGTTRRTPAATARGCRVLVSGRESCCAATLSTCAPCRRPPSSARSCLRGGAASRRSGRWSVTWSRRAGSTGPACASWRSTTTPASGSRSDARRTRGQPHEAVMASCAIPGWYQPVRIGDAPLHRRRGVVVDQPRPHGRAGARRGLRPGAAGQLRPRRAQAVAHPGRAAVAQPGDAAGAARAAPRARRRRRGDGAGPGEEDLEAFGGNLMDVSRRPLVIETSLRTSAIALHDPAPLPDRSDFEDVG